MGNLGPSRSGSSGQVRQTSKSCSNGAASIGREDGPEPAEPTWVLGTLEVLVTGKEDPVSELPSV